MWRLRSGSLGAYAFATLCVTTAVLLHLGIRPITDDSQHFTTFYPAVLIATIVGGVGAGVYAVVSSAIIAWWALIPPHFGFFPPIPVPTAVSLLIYLLASLILVLAAEHYRRLINRLEEEERFRKLTVEELAHRLKNKIATIQAIISLQLRDSPQARDAIVGRLTRLAATDDLILQTQGQGARLREILCAELGPYEGSRISIKGPGIFLSPKLALTMALLIHELATNSAKYGSLSNATGRVAICWSLFETRLTLEWRESGGPLVAPPTHRGFGTRLLSRALDEFGGIIETTFAPTGIVCKLSATVPGNTVPIVAENNEPFKKTGGLAGAETVAESAPSSPSTFLRVIRNRQVAKTCSSSESQNG